MRRWTKTVQMGNDGKPLAVWAAHGLEVARNVNLGHEGGWRWEVTEDGERLEPLHPSLDAAKRFVEALADERERAWLTQEAS